MPIFFLNRITLPAARRALGGVVVGVSLLLGAAGAAGTAWSAALPAADTLLRDAAAARDAKNWKQALLLYTRGQSAYPSQRLFAVGEVMTLADAGNADTALARGKRLLQRYPNEPDAYVALAYAHQRAQQFYAALQVLTQAHERWPGLAYITREYVFALQRAGLPQPALALAQKNPALLNAAQLRLLEGDMAAELARMGAEPTLKEADRFVIADRAIAYYDQLLERWSALGEEAARDVQRARIDRLHALHARVRMHDVVDGYEALLADGVTVPDYALGDVASAYLYLRQPEQAAALYARVVGEPGKPSASARAGDEIGYYYALLESNRYEEALQVIAAADERQPVWRWLPGQPERQPNPEKLDTRLARAMAYSATNDLPRSVHDVQALSNAAPSNVNLATAKASLYRSRGWPRAAESELLLAQAREPRALAVEVEQGYTALDLQEWQQARLLRDDVMQRFPENLAAQRLSRLLQVHDKNELRISGYRGLAQDNPAVGNRDFGVDTVVYSRPLAENWRVFAGTGLASTRYQDTDTDYRWGRAGVEWRGRGTTIEAEVSSNQFGHGAQTGARVAFSYDVSDTWQVSAGAERLGRDTPLRALQNDITSNGANAALTWQPNERRRWTLLAGRQHFSDGNRRTQLGLGGRERIYSAPTWELDMLLDGFAQRNTADDAPYFNPSRDLTATASVQASHTLYQFYETVWQQQLLAGAGIYSQQGYGGAGLFTLGYGQRFRTNDVLDMGFRVTGTSRPYDGERERELRIVFDLNYRF